VVVGAAVWLAASAELVSTTVAVRMLLPVVKMLIVLVLRGLASRAHLSDEHGVLLTSTGWISVFAHVQGV